MRKVVVDLKVNSYPIYIRQHLLPEIGYFCQRHGIRKKIVLITDDTVQKLYAQEVENQLNKADFEVLKISVCPGEQSKSLSTADKIYEKLIVEKIDRQASILALGGGVIGDLAGFVASTYKRGIAYFQIPTTLLAQTDSSVGGKVGINHKLGKNLIGSFYHPQFVLIDPAVLKTLGRRDVVSGLGEVIKYGLICDADLFELIKINFPQMVTMDQATIIEEIIGRCCRIKADIVSQDEKECGVRAILNFGHTIGHALEAATNYEYFRHGEAVILGMMAMVWLSAELNVMAKSECETIQNFLNKTIKIDFPSHLTLSQILQSVYFDKKIIDRQLNVILLNKIGCAIIKRDIKENQLLQAINFLCHNFGRQ